MATIFRADNTEVIFSSLILYFIPITLDYFGHTPLEEKNERRRNLTLWVSVGLTVLFLALLLMDLELNGFFTHIISKSFFCILASVFVAVACVDWVTYSTEDEVKHREKIREEQRKQQQIYRFEERVKANEKVRETSESISS